MNCQKIVPSSLLETAVDVLRVLMSRREPAAKDFIRSLQDPNYRPGKSGAPGASRPSLGFMKAFRK